MTCPSWWTRSAWRSPSGRSHCIFWRTRYSRRSRNHSGTLTALQPRGDAAPGTKQRLESFQHVEVDRIVDPEVLKSLAAQIERSMRTCAWPVRIGRA